MTQPNFRMSLTLKDFVARLTLLMCALAFPSISVGDPLLTVSDNGLNGSSNREWLVEVTPDAGLFSGGSGFVDVELAFEISNSDLVSATVNGLDWPFNNPGNNPFTGGVTLGLQTDLTGDTVFASLGGSFTSGNPVPVLTIETQGSSETTLSWGGHVLLGGTPDEYIGSRIAQAGLNFDGLQGSLTVEDASAQTVLIDFGNASSFRGASVTNPDGNGNHWNSVWSGAFYPDIVDIDGNATEIDFGFSSATGNDSFNGPAGTSTDPADADYDAVALGNLGVDEAVFDYYVSSTFEIQQLDSTKTYDLTFFGSHKFNNDPTTVYSIYTDDTYTTLVDSVSLEVHQPGSPSMHNRDTVATISGLSPQTNNILYVKFEGSTGDLGYLNALQIETVTSVVTGDFNNDGEWDCLDIDALTTAIATMSGDLSFDMNHDGSLTLADITDVTLGWLAVSGANNPADTGGNPFLVADANLDGTVDGQDFLAWNTAKFTPNTNWCNGNFNADTTVDGQDFLAWNNNKFMSSDGLTAVPEPSSGSMLLALLMFVWPWPKTTSPETTSASILESRQSSPAA